ncbi:CBS domain-containing protein, partial [Acidovorax cavernicola]
MSERLTAGEICTREVAIAYRHTDLVTAAQLMREHHVGALVVIDETQGLRTVAGVLTDRDIVISVVAPELA